MRDYTEIHEVFNDEEYDEGYAGETGGRDDSDDDDWVYNNYEEDTQCTEGQLQGDEENDSAYDDWQEQEGSTWINEAIPVEEKSALGEDTQDTRKLLVQESPPSEDASTSENESKQHLADQIPLPESPSLEVDMATSDWDCPEPVDVNADWLAQVSPAAVIVNPMFGDRQMYYDQLLSRSMHEIFWLAVDEVRADALE